MPRKFWLHEQLSNVDLAFHVDFGSLSLAGLTASVDPGGGYCDDPGPRSGRCLIVNYEAEETNSPGHLHLGLVPHGSG
jgi:hypothetical protein